MCFSHIFLVLIRHVILLDELVYLATNLLVNMVEISASPLTYCQHNNGQWYILKAITIELLF